MSRLSILLLAAAVILAGVTALCGRRRLRCSESGSGSAGSLASRWGSQGARGAGVHNLPRYQSDHQFDRLPKERWQSLFSR